MRTVSEFEPILSQIMLMIAKDTRFRCRPGLAKVFEENPRLVIAINHAAPLSWLPAGALLCAHASAKGGGTRRPMSVVDRFFFTMPGLRQVANFITQNDKPLNFLELLKSFERGDGTDLVVFPEGSNCFFGDPSVLQPFRSPRFVEIAIEAYTPILVCAHRGSEAWGQTVDVDPQWLSHLEILPKFVAEFLETRLKQTGTLTIPLWPQPMDKFEMICELVPLQLKADELSSDPTERRAQIVKESERIREKMQALLDEIDSGAARSAEGAAIEGH